MGAISSCFGRGEASESSSNDETRRLLHTPYQGGYGTTGIVNSEQGTSEAARRERDALDGIYHSMTDNIFDVFTPQTQGSSSVPEIGNTGMAQTDDEDLASEEMRLRTIRKGRSGPVFSSINKVKADMSAVQAVIG